MSQKNPKNASGGGKGAPKGKKSAVAGKKAEDEREETLQAVV
jgi:translation initiation factor eIF-2B subunit epsilon